jgi:hypothetical protein
MGPETFTANWCFSSRFTMTMPALCVTSFCAVLLAACAHESRGARHAALMTWSVEQGYQQRAFDGQIVYCRAMIPTGSHIEETDCITETVLADRKYWWDSRNPSAK